MSHQEGLINLSLSEPTLLLRGEEDFDGHSLLSPFAHPHLSVTPFADLLHHLNLLGNGSLHLETCDKNQEVLKKRSTDSKVYTNYFFHYKRK